MAVQASLSDESISIEEEDENHEEEFANLTELPEDVPLQVEQIMADFANLQTEMRLLLDQTYQLKSNFVMQNSYQHLAEHFERLANSFPFAYSTQIILRYFELTMSRLAEDRFNAEYAFDELLDGIRELIAFAKKSLSSARDKLLEATITHVALFAKQAVDTDTNPAVTEALEQVTAKAEDKVDQELTEFLELSNTLQLVEEMRTSYVYQLLETMLDYENSQVQTITECLNAISKVELQ
uniref:DUF47 family protein n=1 Tax=Trichuris muris TaxID=70415 RepID=A0A5S6QY83_TRIMR